MTSAFELCFTKWSSPLTNDRFIKWEVMMAGMAAGSLRALIECPFEYLKVRRMAKVDPCLSDCYRGFTTLYPRSVLLLTTYFTFVDVMRRKTKLMELAPG